MIQKTNDELIAVCDECGVTLYGGTLDFKEFIADVKENGWKISKEDDKWIHVCWACQAY